MYKYIYQIKNIVNQKCYIGQSVDWEDRWRQHQRQLQNHKHENPYLQYAWDKYGEDAFQCTPIDYTEDYNAMEKYYISYFDSLYNKCGYNILPGGDEPPVGSHSKITCEDAWLIKQMLMRGDKTKTILETVQWATPNIISQINIGSSWKEDALNYPLNPQLDPRCVGRDIINEIIYLLSESSMKQKDIAVKYGVSRSFVTALNNGTVMQYYDKSRTYPLRNRRCTGACTDDPDIVLQIISDLQNTTLSQQNIADKNNTTASIVWSINTGKHQKYRQPGISYPIRKCN